jgi:citrate synthase
VPTAEKPKAGLEDVVATSSAICYLDGERGVLAYCGYDIHDLAANATFEEVCYPCGIGGCQIAPSSAISNRSSPPRVACLSRSCG